MPRKKKEAAAGTGPVFDAQKQLVIAHVQQASEETAAIFNEAMDAAEAGRFDDVEGLMVKLKSVGQTVLAEASRFAKTQSDTTVEYDEEEKARKKGKRARHDDDADDDDDDY